MIVVPVPADRAPPLGVRTPLGVRLGCPDLPSAPAGRQPAGCVGAFFLKETDGKIERRYGGKVLG